MKRKPHHPDPDQINQADTIFSESKDKMKLLKVTQSLGHRKENGIPQTLSFQLRDGCMEAIFTPDDQAHYRTSRWMPFGTKTPLFKLQTS